MKYLPWAAVGVALLVVAGCEAEPPLVKSEPPVVTVSQPLEKDVTDSDVYTGRLDSLDTVEVRARVFGELTAIHFKDGALVKEGDLLFEIDPRTYKAILESAKAKLETAKASYQLADSEYERERDLYRTKASSAREMDVWLAKKAIAVADRSGAEAEIERAKLDVEFCKIKAPLSGRISRSLVSKGNLVNTRGADTLLTTIVSVDPIQVYFDVDEPALQRYRERRAREQGAGARGKQPEIPAYLGLSTDGDRFPREGKLDFAENRINPATGTIRVRAVFDNKDGMLTPGQFARVRLPVGDQYKGLLVTDNAIGIDQGQKYLLIVKDNKAEYRPVTPGRLDGGLRIFPPGAGLNPGEWVIVNGVQRVRPGIEVRPERVPMPTPPGPNGKADAGKQTEK